MTERYDKIIAKIDEMSIAVKPRRCTRNHGSNCSLCFEACPVEAITIQLTDEARETPVIDFTYCNSCGLCANLCPTETFVLKDISDQKLVDYLDMISDRTGQVAFFCEIQADELEETKAAPPVVLPCLARLNEATLVAAAASGFRAVWANRKWCETCVNNHAEGVIDRTVGFSNSLISVFGGSCEIEYAEEPPRGWRKPRLFRKKLPPLADFEPVSRRGFFDNIKKGAVKAGLVLLDNELSDLVRTPGRAGPEYHLPNRRRLMLEALARLEPSNEVELQIDNFPWRNLEITEACTGCESCVLYCPSQALTKATADEKAAIAFSISNCVKCDVCRDLCPEKAVVFKDSFLSTRLSERKRWALASFSHATCSQCKSDFLSQGEANLCRYCQKKKALFGS